MQEKEEDELRRGSQLSHWVSGGQQGYCQDKVTGVQAKNEDIVRIKSQGSEGEKKEENEVRRLSDEGIWVQ